MPEGLAAFQSRALTLSSKAVPLTGIVSNAYGRSVIDFVRR